MVFVGSGSACAQFPEHVNCTVLSFRNMSIVLCPAYGTCLLSTVLCPTSGTCLLNSVQLPEQDNCFITRLALTPKKLINLPQNQPHTSCSHKSTNFAKKTNNHEK